jgi:hypothetical protein
MDARLAFYLKIDPTKLSDEEWALKVAQLEFVITKDKPVK